jgi:type VI protein secretion system component VasA
VSPAIELNQLSLAGSVSQLTVVSQNTVSLSVTSLSTIDATSKIVMQVPTGVFLSISGLNSQKCLYSIGGVNFTACSFAVNSQGWVQQVNLTNLGSSPVASNTPIKVELTLTNSWSVEPFSLKLIDVFVCSQEDSYLSKGSISVTTLTQAQNFAATALTNVTSSQTSKVADTQNSLTVSYVLPVSASPNTLVTLSIPKSTYTLNLSALTTNIAPSSSL